MSTCRFIALKAKTQLTAMADIGNIVVGINNQ